MPLPRRCTRNMQRRPVRLPVTRLTSAWKQWVGTRFECDAAKLILGSLLWLGYAVDAVYWYGHARSRNYQLQPIRVIWNGAA
ncbi:hypothetical protein BU25DRAFT_142775 [Macroventuria anomochaeta]|uniref:Uncharacterized protein n=1 Tax=Macroventuria anomochaeta TaxID=301207 RepID=A0ACB6SDY0_9PLEO|nr:uncharacterized protein BU25DRAFT_142775 [Macroventuria anomochaeta]KAF2632173.1 hypothetical protein BU25DRAFT_142775 [Macroventuria anomochaeta]